MGNTLKIFGGAKMKRHRKLKAVAIFVLTLFFTIIALLLIPSASVPQADGTAMLTYGAAVALIIAPSAFTALFVWLDKRVEKASLPQKPFITANGEAHDPLIPDAIKVVMETGQASVSMLQRKLNLGYSQALRLIDEMETLGIVGSFDGSRPRQILLTRSQCEALIPTLRISRANSCFAPCEASSPEAELYKVDGMEGHDFEYWCADLLKKNGFSNVEVTRGSGDQGVDVLAKFGDAKYAIQCKCYSSDLGNKPVQEVNAGKAFYHCHIGVVMTNRYFTAGAKEIAEATGVLLWDRDTLKRLIKNGGSNDD